jgi:hypothetical protein
MEDAPVMFQRTTFLAGVLALLSTSVLAAENVERF